MWGFFFLCGAGAAEKQHRSFVDDCEGGKVSRVLASGFEDRL